MGKGKEEWGKERARGGATITNGKGMGEEKKKPSTFPGEVPSNFSVVLASMAKNKLRNWMIYLAVAFAWVSG